MQSNPFMQMADEWHTAHIALTQHQPIVSIFGSARLPPTSPEYILATQVAKRLSDEGFSILSGGGPGIMEAANKGAFEGKSQSIGLNIVLPHEQHPNTYQHLSMKFENFASRKATFVRHSMAFIVFAGGFGTLDELFDLITQLQTHKIAPRPIVLVGRSFWGGLLDWFNAQLVAKGLIKLSDLNLFTILDNTEDIVQHIIQTSKI